MLRTILTHGLPFLAPFVAYFFFVTVIRRAQERGSMWHRTPWYWLTMIGLVLSLLSMLAMGLYREGSDEPYVPKRFEGGKIVPGEPSGAAKH